LLNHVNSSAAVKENYQNILKLVKRDTGLFSPDHTGEHFQKLLLLPPFQLLEYQMVVAGI
jgi:hypothetical protein